LGTSAISLTLGIRQSAEMISRIEMKQSFSLHLTIGFNPGERFIIITLSEDLEQKFFDRKR